MSQEEKVWECGDCGRSLKSELEPNNCACGSDNVEAKEQLSMMEQMAKDYIEDDKKGES